MLNTLDKKQNLSRTIPYYSGFFREVKSRLLLSGKKSFLLLAFFFFLLAATHSQVNLVPNYSFEIYDTCPNNQNQVRYAIGWSSCGDSPDYFNACVTTVPDFSVPNNWAGYQQAASGNAYCAVGSGYGGNFANIREFIIAQLISPLTIGKKYLASFKTSLSLSDTIYANTATNKLGALFSTVPYDASNPTPIVNFAHIYSTNIITDTVNWTTISGSFTADSVYKYIIIGNFFNDTNTDTLIFKKDTLAQGAYYFIDNVSVIEDKTNGISENNNEENYFSINLENGSLTINVNENLKNDNNEVAIFNLLGLKIFNQKIQNNKIVINLSYLSMGLYVLNIKSEHQIFIHKFILFK